MASMRIEYTDEFKKTARISKSLARPDQQSLSVYIYIYDRE